MMMKERASITSSPAPVNPRACPSFSSFALRAPGSFKSPPAASRSSAARRPATASATACKVMPHNRQKFWSRAISSPQSGQCILLLRAATGAGAPSQLQAAAIAVAARQLIETIAHPIIERITDFGEDGADPGGHARPACVIDGQPRKHDSGAAVYVRRAEHHSPDPVKKYSAHAHNAGFQGAIAGHLAAARPQARGHAAQCFRLRVPAGVVMGRQDGISGLGDNLAPQAYHGSDGKIAQKLGLGREADRAADILQVEGCEVMESFRHRGPYYSSFLPYASSERLTLAINGREGRRSKRLARAIDISDCGALLSHDRAPVGAA